MTNPNQRASGGGDGGGLMASADSGTPRAGAAAMENTATRYPFLMLCLVVVITVWD